MKTNEEIRRQLGSDMIEAQRRLSERNRDNLRQVIQVRGEKALQFAEMPVLESLCAEDKTREGWDL